MSVRSFAVLGLATLLLAAAAACEEPAPAPGCGADADCAPGERCRASACEALPGTGGSGGSGAPVDACGVSEDCLEKPFLIVPTIWWDGSEKEGEPVCTVPPGRCTGDELCPIPTACAPPLAGADRPGGFLCESSEQCWSGRCVLLDGVGVCLRSCVTDADCPYAPAFGDLPAVGLSCREVVDAGVPLRTCAPIDPVHPGRTLCQRDCDCTVDDGCTGAPADGTRCLFLGRVDEDQFAGMPVCELTPAGEDRPSTARCADEPESCHGGACLDACQQGRGNGEEKFCSTTPKRCTQPCAYDRDCPARTGCVSGYNGHRRGDWLEPFQQSYSPGRDLRYCQLPANGCFDEVDCCPRPDGAGGCLGGWDPERQRCAAELSPEEQPRLLTRCVDLDPARATPGSCCDGHAACDSGLCVPARAGTACAGGGVCSVPCEPDPDPDGLPGSGDERDRCALGDFGASTYHLESRCLPFSTRLAYTDRTGAAALADVELTACQ